MRMSEKKRQEVFDVISDGIMDLRIDVQCESLNVQALDGRLYKLQQDLWRDIRKTLNISGS